MLPLGTDIRETLYVKKSVVGEMTAILCMRHWFWYVILVAITDATLLVP